MSTSFGKAILFIVILLAQVLIFNHICLFGVAVPLVFIYFILRMPINFGINKLLTLSFLLGFLVDVWSDTPGMNALCCTILCMLRKKVYYAYVSHDDRTEVAIPSIASMGLADYAKYCVTLTAIYCILIFSVEYFSVANVKDVAVMAFASLLLTFPILLGIDSLMITRREKRL